MCLKVLKFNINELWELFLPLVYDPREKKFVSLVKYEFMT